MASVSVWGRAEQGFQSLQHCLWDRPRMPCYTWAAHDSSWSVREGHQFLPPPTFPSSWCCCTWWLHHSSCHLSRCGPWVPPVSLKRSAHGKDGSTRRPSLVHRIWLDSFSTQKQSVTQHNSLPPYIYTQHTCIHACTRAHTHPHTPHHSLAQWQATDQSHSGSQLLPWNSVMGAQPWRTLSDVSSD